jgi:hypothetical protein
MAKTFSLSRFSADAKRAVAGAQKLADELSHPRASSLHLLARLLDSDETAKAAFVAIGADPAAVARATREALAAIAAEPESKSTLATDLLELLRRADREAGDREVEVGHLLHALAQEAARATRELLAAHGIKPGSFRQHFVSPIEPPADEEAGAALFRDFASEVRAGLEGVEDREVRERGKKLIVKLVDQLGGPNGIPGLRIERETDTRIRLERMPKDAEITIAWESETGAVSVAKRKGTTSSVARYAWSRHEQRWARVDASGSLYPELHAAIKDCLYPELK